jgi:hypothetical protein
VRAFKLQLKQELPPYAHNNRRPTPMRTIIALTTLVAVTLLSGPVLAQQQITGTGAFCIKGSTGPVKCEYQTMESCQQARPQGVADQCVSRAQAEGTVGGRPRREQPSAPGEQKD